MQFFHFSFYTSSLNYTHTFHYRPHSYQHFIPLVLHFPLFSNLFENIAFFDFWTFKSKINNTKKCYLIFDEFLSI